MDNTHRKKNGFVTKHKHLDVRLSFGNKEIDPKHCFGDDRCARFLIKVVSWCRTNMRRCGASEAVRLRDISSYRGNGMLTVDILNELIERLEKAMRPISEDPNSRDHDRVRELYQYLSQIESGQPLENARLTVLQEMLEPYLPSVQPEKVQDLSALTYNTKAVIGALVVFLCHLDDGALDAADATLQAAFEMLRETNELIRGLKGDFALA
jgi:hypothetical protein